MGYYLFAGHEGFNNPGWYSFEGHYETLKQAIAHAYSHTEDHDGWVQIVDAKEHIIVKIWSRFYGKFNKKYWGDKLLPEDPQEWDKLIDSHG